MPLFEYLIVDCMACSTKEKKRVTRNATLICVYVGLAYRLILFDVAAFAGFAAGLAAINSSAGDTPSAVSVTTVMKPGP